MLSELPDRAHALADDRAVMPLGAEPGDGEEREPDERGDAERHDGPVRHLGRQQDPDDEDRRRHEVEEPVREDRPHEHGARPGRRIRKVAAQRRHARELSEPARNDGVREQADAERREHVDQARLVLLRQRLADREPPRERPEERRHDVEEEREDDPAPDHEAERVEDASPVRSAPPDDDEREHERDESDEHLSPAGAPHAQRRSVTLRRACSSGSPVTSA